ncbi:Translocator protein [Orchesella cincta]|uniref:Translocator protein n=1 Tax=Orchesella cincta TaxID=48709 RepID=A0A1D2MM33_ORCCI|nr:Translocator protein [Orchesella cincta]
MPVNLPMIGAMVLPNIGGWAGAFITKPNIPTWYEVTFEEARVASSELGVCPVWTSLYTSMGYASYLVYQSGGGFEGEARVPLMLYASQLALNWAWTPLFFGAKKLGLSVIEIGLLYGNILACAYAFSNVNRTAGLLMLPYIAWSTLACALTYCIWRDNGGDKNK